MPTGTAQKGPAADFARLVASIHACRICRDRPEGRPLPHDPRPVLQVSPTARICVAGQAPGTRVHASGRPYTDPSGDRLRAWMGIGSETFYDVARIAIVPMGFCFPGLDAKGGDLPPRRECAPAWRTDVFASIPALELLLVVGTYAQTWHLGSRAGPTLTETVADWRAIMAASARKAGPLIMPLPHPSWRNNAWIKRNPWFEAELLPALRTEIRRILAPRSE
jgi:uracil-DNA glycosylase